MLYRIKMICYDYGNPTPFEDEPADTPRFNTVKEAYDYAWTLADDEAEFLNEDCSEFTSFGLVENVKENTITVNCYMLEDEEDDTGETEPVTIYCVEEVKEN